MADSLLLNGIVLSSMPMGENDRRIVLLTKERGQISAFARGARKPKSPLSAGTNPFSFGTFRAFEGRNSYTVVEASVRKYFDKLSRDYDDMCMASYFLEVAEYFSGENIDETDRLNLLYLSLSVLENGKLPRELVRRIYELRTLRINGEYPNVFSCVGCGGKEHLHTYSPSHYGMVCDDCVEPGMSGVKISEDLLYVLQFILSVDMKKLYSFELSEELFSGLESFVKAYWHQNIDHTFKTERFL